VTAPIALAELVGFAAAVATVIAFCCKRMGPLRAAAITANLLFITYGALLGLLPVLLLHCVLLPLNIAHFGACLRERQGGVRHSNARHELPGRRGSRGTECLTQTRTQ